MKVTKEFYEIEDRRYIDLDGERIKVPWRYGRVMGVDIYSPTARTIQSLKIGEVVQARIKFVEYEGKMYKILANIYIK